MYAERVAALDKSFKMIKANNLRYTTLLLNAQTAKRDNEQFRKDQEDLKILDAIVAKKESDWRRYVLDKLEAEIDEALAYVFPADNYHIHLNPRVLRGRIHIDTAITSPHAKDIYGTMDDTQGRLFQQVVSLADLMAVMKLLGVSTVYVDEAYSGVAPNNLELISQLLCYYQAQNVNLIIIAQNGTRLDVPGHYIILDRTVDNKTLITERGQR